MTPDNTLPKPAGSPTAPAPERSRLEDVLAKYYRVQGRTFAETDPVNVCKHQVLHLAKLTKKLAICAFEPTPVHEDTVVNEVVPDLLIYAQELSWKFGGESALNSQLVGAGERSIHRMLAQRERYTNLAEALVAVCLATAAMADMCDRFDHEQPSEFDAQRDAISPFLRAAATLQAKFNCATDVVYARRLDYMRAKYEGWS